MASAYEHDPTDPTGVRDETPRGNQLVSRARDRKAHAALQLRREGYTWDEVAEVIGYPSARMALVAVERALEKDLKNDESQAFMRQMAGQRLDRLLKTQWKRAVDPEHPEHYAAFDRVRQVIADHRKLYGLDAPTAVTVNSPAQAELEKWVATVVSGGAEPLQEADIFDAEVIEDRSSTVELEVGPSAMEDE